MTTPILTALDIDYIMGATNEAIVDRERYAETLYTTLMDAARAVDLRTRFWEAVYHGRSTRFILAALPVRHRFDGKSISIEDVINEQSVLDRLEKGCGNHVQATYEVENSHHLNVYLEFVPPTKSILNPENEISEINIPVANEELWSRRLAKETSW